MLLIQMSSIFIAEAQHNLTIKFLSLFFSNSFLVFFLFSILQVHRSSCNSLSPPLEKNF